MTRLEPTHCLVYAPYSFSGRGPAESCAQIVAAARPEGLAKTVFAGRCRKPLAGGVAVVEPLGVLGRMLPWPTVKAVALTLLQLRFLWALRRCDPATTVAHFWPGSPRRAVLAAKRRGMVTVREMINAACATSGPILDAAYARLGLPATHLVTEEVIVDETEELGLYDYFFASNPEVERSLKVLGIREEQILPTSFGWDPVRFAQQPDAPRAARPFRAVFTGRVGVRKGVPELLAAWEEAGIDGQLVLAGPIDAEIAGLVQHHVESGSVIAHGYVDNPADIYRDADVFVFPTLEEGGPQVTYEAAGCGLPVITTPMGAARLVENGRNGIIVDPGAVDQIADGLRLLAGDPDLRERFATAARADAQRFAYPVVGAARANQLRSLAGGQQAVGAGRA